METTRFSEKNSFPQSGAFYAEDKDIFGVLMKALQELVITRPENPVQGLIRYFMRNIRQVIKIAIIGPPLSGRRTLATQLAEVFDVPLLDYDRLYETVDPQLQMAVTPFHDKCEPLPPEMAYSLIRQRIFSDDCIAKGWILCGFPETRAQDDLFRRQGISPLKTIILQTDPAVLLERRRHYLFDPVDKRPYHSQLYMPVLKSIAKRLIVPQKYTKGQLAARMQEFAYESILISKACGKYRPTSPLSPCAHATNENVSVSSGSLVMRAAVDSEHDNYKEINALLNRERQIPDDMVGEMVCRALAETDLVGFILRGFPQNRVQAELLDRCGFRPSRVLFFDCPSEIAQQRLLRRANDLFDKATQLTDLYDTQRTSVLLPSSDRKWGVKDVEAQAGIIRSQDKLYENYENDLRTYYQDISLAIDATLSLKEMFEKVRCALVHPMPLKTKKALTPVRTAPFQSN
ncbi:adenylate kinase 8-like [Paramacrobiotus metropolitanus]|uniref:adenylate kinase 8-like n=1 Tax=Paramacrobiotus metropolitanus TaxID=2943436 RepID=UPI002445D839|nr:adenylate kinase 8-like [Paramacrobiotus metropolitanus]